MCSAMGDGEDDGVVGAGGGDMAVGRIMLR